MKWPSFAGLVLTTGLMTTSCLQPPDSMKDDFGPDASSQDVEKALASAWGSADPASIQNNEFMYLEQEQRISNFDTKIIYKESTQVTQRAVTTDSIDYTLLIRSTSLDSSGNFKPITATEQQVSVPNTGAAPAPAPAPSPTPGTKAAFPTSLEALQASMAAGSVGLYSGELHERFLGIQTFMTMLKACEKAQDWDVTCHNLQVAEGLRPVPDLIAAKPNCGGFSNCQLHYKKVTFNLVVPVTDPKSNVTSNQEVIYQLTFSPDVPYLSRLIEFCYEGLVTTATEKIPVTMCNRVQDFDPGQNTP